MGWIGYRHGSVANRSGMGYGIAEADAPAPYGMDWLPSWMGCPLGDGIWLCGGWRPRPPAFKVGCLFKTVSRKVVPRVSTLKVGGRGWG